MDGITKRRKGIFIVGYLNDFLDGHFHALKVFEQAEADDA
jgi:hypothetical protein